MHIWKPPLPHHLLNRGHDKELSAKIEKLNSRELDRGHFGSNSPIDWYLSPHWMYLCLIYYEREVPGLSFWAR